MPIEIERKFLVANDHWRSAVIKSDKLVDGLIGEFNGSKIRVRIGQHETSLSVKGPRAGTTRTEFEYDIPDADAAAILKTVCDQHLFEKTRHTVEHAGFIWSIDVYEGRLAGIIIAEIELEDERASCKTSGGIWPTQLVRSGCGGFRIVVLAFAPRSVDFP